MESTTELQGALRNESTTSGDRGPDWTLAMFFFGTVSTASAGVGYLLYGVLAAIIQRAAPRYASQVVPVGDAEFESLLEQVRGLHRLADELTYAPARFNEHVRARLNWDVNPPSLPAEQRELADQIVEVLGTQRLSSSQSQELHRILFGR